MSETTQQATKPPRIWRPIVLWTAGILLALGIVWPAAQVASSLRQVSAVLDEFGPGCSTAPDKFFDEMCPYYVERLGGAERAAAKLGLYLRMPRRWTEKEYRSYRWVAVTILGYCGRSGVPHLLRELHDQPKLGERTEESALGALGRIGPEAQETIPDLVRMEAHPKDVREEAITGAIAKIGPEAKVLIPLLGEEEARFCAKDHLVAIGLKAVPELIAALKNSNPAVRRMAAYVLADIKPVPAEVVPALLAALDDPDGETRREAGFSLCRIEPSGGDVALALAKALGSRDTRVREYAAHVLGGMGSTAAKAQSALEKALADEDAGVRSAAADALRKIRAAQQTETEQAGAETDLGKALEEVLREMKKPCPDATVVGGSGFGDAPAVKVAPVEQP